MLKYYHIGVTRGLDGLSHPVLSVACSVFFLMVVERIPPDHYYRSQFIFYPPLTNKALIALKIKYNSVITHIS